MNRFRALAAVLLLFGLLTVPNLAFAQPDIEAPDKPSQVEQDLRKLKSKASDVESSAASNASRIKRLSHDVDTLKGSVATLQSQLARYQKFPNHFGSAGSVAFLFGAFCALWAQNTRRGPWLWFFLGLFFSVFAVIAVLVKNRSDQRAARR